MSRLVWRATSLLALALVLPSAASAQFGALKKKARAAAQHVVEERMPFTPKEAPEFNARVLEIDDAHLEGLLRGFQAEITWMASAVQEADAEARAYERALADFEAAQESYGPLSEKWESCAADFGKAEDAVSAANHARVGKALEELDEEELERFIEEVALRGEELTRELQAGKTDEATMRALEEYKRDIERVTLEQQRRGMLAMSGAVDEQRRVETQDARLEAACGKKPEAPVRPSTALDGPEGVLAAKGAEAAGLTPAQYAVMRERVLYWWEQDQRPAKMGYTREEIDLLEREASRVDEALKAMKRAGVPL